MVYYIKKFQNMILLFRYIVSNEISLHQRCHSRSLLECPSESWYMRICFCQLFQNDYLLLKFSIGGTGTSLAESSQNCKVAGESLEPLNQPEIVSRRKHTAHQAGTLSWYNFQWPAISGQM